MDIKTVVETYKKFNSSSKNRQAEIHNENENVWKKTFEEFVTVCNYDENLNSDFKKLEDLNKLMNYSIETDSQFTHGYSNEYGEIPDEVKAFARDCFLKQKEFAQIWPEKKDIELQKIKQIKQSKFVLFKDKKIAKIRNDIRFNDQKYDYMQKVLQILEKQEKNKYTYKYAIEDLTLTINSKMEYNAETVIQKALEEHPNLICEKPVALPFRNPNRRCTKFTYPCNFICDELTKIQKEVNLIVKAEEKENLKHFKMNQILNSSKEQNNEKTK